MSLIKVGDQAGVPAYFEVSNTGVATFSDGTTSTTITPGGSASIVNLVVSGTSTIGNDAADVATITGHVDLDAARTTAGSGLDIDMTINSASAAASGLDITAVQLTTARTSGTVNGVKVATTSLAGDTSSVVYADYRAAAPTDGGGTVIHVAMEVEAGHDQVIGMSGLATGQGVFRLGLNLASAAVWSTASADYLTFVTTTSALAVKIDQTLDLNALVDHDVTLTATGEGINSLTQVNHATASVEGAQFYLAALTTARTAGTASAMEVACSGLAGDTSGTTYQAMNAIIAKNSGSSVANAIRFGSGWDSILDCSGMATGEADVILPDNKVSAFAFREGSTEYLSFNTADSGGEWILVSKPLNLGASVKLLSDDYVRATVAVADAGGGGTTSLTTVQLYRADGTTAVGSARQVLLVAQTTQYRPFTADIATITFGTATTGAIIASGNGWCLCQTSAAGAFACTTTNSADGTWYFQAISAQGVSVVGESCRVLGSNVDAAAWSA